MIAVVSGQAGVAIVLDEDHANAKVLRRNSDQPEVWDRRFVWPLVANCTDARDIEVENELAARTALNRAWMQDQCLQLMLILLDADAEQESRAAAAECIADFFADTAVIEFVANRLYSAPLPANADPGGAAAFARACACSALRSFLDELVASQPAIRALRESWTGVLDDLFASKDAKLQVGRAVVESGYARALAWALHSSSRLKPPPPAVLTAHSNLIQDWFSDAASRLRKPTREALPRAAQKDYEELRAQTYIYGWAKLWEFRHAWSELPWTALGVLASILAGALATAGARDYVDTRFIILGIATLAAGGLFLYRHSAELKKSAARHALLADQARAIFNYSPLFAQPSFKRPTFLVNHFLSSFKPLFSTSGQDISITLCTLKDNQVRLWGSDTDSRRGSREVDSVDDLREAVTLARDQHSLVFVPSTEYRWAVCAEEVWPSATSSLSWQLRLVRPSGEFPVAPRSGRNSVLCAPISLPGEASVIAVLCLVSKQRNAFDGFHFKAAELAAYALAMSIKPELPRHGVMTDQPSPGFLNDFFFTEYARGPLSPQPDLARLRLGFSGRRLFVAWLQRGMRLLLAR